MLTINLFDEIFRHCTTSSNIPPINLTWVRDQIEWPGTTIFTDHFVNSPIVSKVKCKNKILWLLESREITAPFYKLSETFYNQFDTVLTHDKHLIDTYPNKFRFGLTGSQREIQQDGFPTGVFPKTKLVSTIVSQKRQTIGHRFRHEVVAAFRSKMDVYGREYNPIPNVSLGLKDYMFSVTVENSYYDYYFTEKILNRFYMGTIPIYWGSPAIGKFFDPQGIILFQHLGELAQIIHNLKPRDYEDRIEAVKKNYELAQQYISAEEWMFHNIRDILF